MARKVVNRKELRRINDAAESAEEDEVDDETGDDEESKPAKASKKKEKEPAKRKSRAKVAKEVRLKAFWGVFNQSLKRVALFEYSERKQAEKKAGELSTSQKSPHFVQPVKEVIAE